MHRKVSILECEAFMTEFIGDVGGEDVDIFGGLATPTRETEMYNTMVSNAIGTFHIFIR